MHADKLYKHKQNTRFDRAAEIRLRRRDVELVQRSGDIEFNMYVREGVSLVEGVSQFKYL